jgi:hypothetical protein
VGREARCEASWGARSGSVTVHLDSAELTARGAFRATAPLASIREVRVTGDTLRFHTGADDVALMLGRAAERWAAALTKPPPALATKLGITATTRVLVEGTIDDDALAGALANAPAGTTRTADLVVARVDDAGALARIATARRAMLERGVPLWVVYTKGKGAPLGEAAVRALLRERGLTDLKVAAVSPVLTALKFARLGRK